MPASRATVHVHDGLRNLFCLACGTAVYTQMDGQPEHTCGHVRFFIDWEGELSLGDPDSSTGVDQDIQRRIVEVVEATGSWDEFLVAVAAILPASVLLLEVLDAARSTDGAPARAVICFDIAQLDDE